MNTKLMMLCFALLFSTVHSFAQKDQGFVLTGQFKGLPNGTKVYLRTQEEDTVASTVSKGDQFVFKGKLPLDGRFHFIVMDTLVSKESTNSIFLENKLISVTGEVGKRDVVVKGSSAFAEEQEYLALTNPIRAKVKETGEQSIKIQLKLRGAADTIDKVELTRKLEDVKAQGMMGKIEFKETALDWLTAHNNSFYTPWVLVCYRGFLKPDEMQKVYDQLTPEIKAGYYADQVKSTLNAPKIGEGLVIADFLLPTPDGKKVSILDVASKSKYTLIDCWASWCSPCRAEVPALKEVYAAFKDKGFGIVGISSDKDISKWKKAVAEDATPWSHLLESDKKEITNTYDLRAIPAYMLIDNKGRLVAFDVLASNIKPFGPSLRGEKLKKTLEDLLAEGEEF